MGETTNSTAHLFANQANKRAVMNAKPFREAVCEQLGVPPKAYEEEVLWRCLFPSARPLARLLRLLNSHFFDDDLELIRSVADCAALRELRAELSDYRYHKRIRGFLRSILHVRVSGQRLGDLGAKVLN